MSRLAKWLIVAAAAIVLVVVAAVIAVPFLVDTPRMQAYIASTASQAVGRPVKFTSMSVAVLPLPAVALHGLEIADDPQFSPEPFLRLDTGRISLRLAPLFTGRVELGDITLKKPLITVIQAPDGRLNVATLGTASPEPATTDRGASRPPRGGAAGTAAIAGSKITIDDGVVTFVQRGKGTPTRYHVEDLDLTLTGGATQLGIKADAKVKPGDLSLELRDGIVAITPGKALTDAALRGKLAVQGKDIGELARTAAGPSPALGGGIAGTLALGGTLGSPSATGDVQLSSVTVTQESASCPEPKRRTLALPSIKLNAAYQDARFAGRPLTTAIGDGTITTQLLVSLERGVRVQMNDLAIKGLPLEKVLVDFLCQGYAVTGPLDLTGTLGFSPTNIWQTLSGPGQLRIGPGRVVGSQALALFGSVVRVGGALSAALTGDVPQLASGSPLEFESITGNYTLDNGVFATKNLLYSSKAMKVAVAGTYALAGGQMNLDMTVSTGRTDLQAKVTGNASSPSVRVQPGSLLQPGSPASKQIERGLGDLLKRLR